MAAVIEVYDIIFVKLRLYAADVSRLSPIVRALEKLSQFDASQSNNILNAIAALKKASSPSIFESIVPLCNRFWSPAKRQTIGLILQTQLNLLLKTSDSPLIVNALLSLNDELLLDDWTKTSHVSLLTLRSRLILKNQTNEIDELLKKMKFDEAIINEAFSLFSRLSSSSHANTPTEYVSDSELEPVLMHDLIFMPSSFITKILNSKEILKQCLKIWWKCLDLAKDPQLSEEIIDLVIKVETESRNLVKLFEFTAKPEIILQKMKNISNLPAEQILGILQHPLSLDILISLNDDLRLLAYQENRQVRKKSLKLLFSNPQLNKTRPVVATPFNLHDNISVLEAFESSRTLVNTFLCFEDVKPSETLQIISDRLCADDGSLSYFITLMVQRIKGLVEYEPTVNSKDLELAQFYRKHFASFWSWYEGIRKTLFVKLIHARCFGYAYYHIYNHQNLDFCEEEALEMMKWASMTKQDGLLMTLKKNFGNIIVEDYEMDEEQLLDMISCGIDPLGEHPLILERLQNPKLEKLDIDDGLFEFKKALEMLNIPLIQFDPSVVSNEIWVCLWPQLYHLPEHLARITPRLGKQFPEFVPNEETAEFYRCLDEIVSQTWDEKWHKCFSKILGKIEGQSIPLDLLSEAKDLFSKTLAQRSRLKSPHETIFAGKFGIVIHKLLQAKDPIQVVTEFKRVASDIAAMVKEENLKVSKLCPRLKELAKSGKVVLPGTFSFAKGSLLYSGPKKVVGIDELIVRLPSKSTPKKIKLILDDQKAVEYLLKSGSEIIIEERINQLAWLINDPNIRSLQMIRLQADSWLIEWIPNSTSCFQVVEKYNPLTGPKDFSVPAFLAHHDSSALDSFSSFQSQVPKDLLLNYCLGKGTGSILQVQESMANCLGALSAFCYLLGIGDRHLDNILIDADGQKMYCVDLSVCFGEGTRLAIPECVPFRFTKTFQALIGHFDDQFKTSFCSTLNGWRSLLPEIKAFLDFWIRYPAGKFKTKTYVVDEECEEEVLMPRSRSLILSGLVDEVLARGNANGIVFEGVKYQNDNDLVNALLKAASDVNRLAKMYPGWMSWI